MGLRPLAIEFLFHFDFLVGFDHIAFLDIVAALERDTALKVGSNFFDVVFEAFEGSDVASEDHHTIADETRLVGA